MIQIFAVEGMPEVVAGDDIAALILAALGKQVSTGSTTEASEISTGSIRSGSSIRSALEDGDIVVVTSKIVSKAEGRSV